MEITTMKLCLVKRQGKDLWLVIGSADPTPQDSSLTLIMVVAKMRYHAVVTFIDPDHETSVVDTLNIGAEVTNEWIKKNIIRLGEMAL